MSSERTRSNGLDAAQYAFDKLPAERKAGRTRPGSAKKAGSINPNRPTRRGRTHWWNRSVALKGWSPPA